MKFLHTITMIVILLLTINDLKGQCNQHVFTSVGAEKWTNFQYQDCGGLNHYFGLPSGGSAHWQHQGFDVDRFFRHLAEHCRHGDHSNGVDDCRHSVAEAGVG